MNYNFFADKADKIKILEYIFTETDLQIFDHYSKPGEEITEYKNADEITSKFDLKNGGQFAVTFQLWTPRFNGEILFKKIDLNPKYCKGQIFRYSTEGWGLIQLYFGGLENNQLHQSHIGHFNEKGALGNEGINLFNGKVSNWDWKEIQQTSGKLKYQIYNKLAVRKMGSSGILQGADELVKQGVKLI